MATNQSLAEILGKSVESQPVRAIVQLSPAALRVRGRCSHQRLIRWLIRCARS